MTSAFENSSLHPPSLHPAPPSILPLPPSILPLPPSCPSLHPSCPSLHPAPPSILPSLPPSCPSLRSASPHKIVSAVTYTKPLESGTGKKSRGKLGTITVSLTARAACAWQSGRNHLRDSGRVLKELYEYWYASNHGNCILLRFVLRRCPRTSPCWSSVSRRRDWTRRYLAAGLCVALALSASVPPSPSGPVWQV